ncbi:nectin-1-like [Oncorhynchus clarkii lewisi]|uniref:nectin-1-like n=1 Tax=Oncorhynchus clarkii lewisi TaxID=490388 RepID=UPI0039B92477
MRTLVFLHAFALVCVHSRIMKDAENTRSICGKDSVLRCKENSLPGVKYRSVRWYKLVEEPSNKESGLLMKRLSPNSTTQWYAGLERKVELLADNYFDIFLPNVMAVDSGRYKCLLAAPVGEQNQEGQVHLSVLFSLCACFGCLYNKSTDQSESNTILVLSIVGLVAALR